MPNLSIFALAKSVDVVSISEKFNGRLTIDPISI